MRRKGKILSAWVFAVSLGAEIWGGSRMNQGAYVGSWESFVLGQIGWIILGGASWLFCFCIWSVGEMWISERFSSPFSFCLSQIHWDISSVSSLTSGHFPNIRYYYSKEIWVGDKFAWFKILHSTLWKVDLLVGETTICFDLLDL